MPEPKTIAIISNDGELSATLQAGCESIGLLARCHTTAGAALVAGLDVPSDLMLIDANAECGGGLTILGLLVGYDQFSAAPAILLADAEDSQLVRRCHSMFAYHVIKSDTLFERLQPLLYELVDIEPSRVRKRFDGIADDMPTATAAQESPVALAISTPRFHSPAAATALTMEQAVAFVSSQPALLGDTLGGTIAEASSPEGEEFTTELPPRLLYIPSDSEESNEVKTLLESYGVAVVRAWDRVEGFRLALSQPVLAVLIDVSVPDMETRYLLGRFRSNPITRNLPILVRADEFDRAMERTLLHWGANDLIVRQAGEDLLVETLRAHIDLLPVAQIDQLALLV